MGHLHLYRLLGKDHDIIGLSVLALRGNIALYLYSFVPRTSVLLFAIKA
jgi:hypothetical protein